MLYLRILCAFALGIAGGGIAYLTAGTYKGAMYAVIMGILTGQMITYGIDRAMGYRYMVNFGGGYIFDAIIIGLFFATFAAEMIRMASAGHKRAETRLNFSHESGEFTDFRREVEEYSRENFSDDVDDDLTFGDE
jgi:hypothetical protein